MPYTKPEMFQLIQLKHALILETKGLKNSRKSAYATIKKRFGLTGSRQSVLTQFTTYIEKEMENVLTD